MDTEILANSENQVTTTQGEEQTQVKTFTQDEVNHIVSNRVKKYADYDELKKKADMFDQIEEANKTELQKAQDRANSLQTELDALKKASELRDLRDEVSKAKGVPASLLTGGTREECETQADQILSFAKASPGYPSVPDGGELTHTPKKSTREQFAEWMEQF